MFKDNWWKPVAKSIWTKVYTTVVPECVLNIAVFKRMQAILDGSNFYFLFVALVVDAKLQEGPSCLCVAYKPAWTWFHVSQPPNAIADDCVNSDTDENCKGCDDDIAHVHCEPSRFSETGNRLPTEYSVHKVAEDR